MRSLELLIKAVDKKINSFSLIFPRYTSDFPSKRFKGDRIFPIAPSLEIHEANF